jgi:hypothetical protein
VRLCGVGWLVQGEDVICGLELRDGYEAHLVCFSRLLLVCETGGQGGALEVPTCLPPLLAALMREDILAIFCTSCFARWGLICMSSAIVDAG